MTRRSPARMTSPRLRALAALAGGLLAAACLNNDVTGVRDLSMELTATPSTASVGASVEVAYRATGTGIARLIVDYGDSSADTSTFSGPLEIAGELTHSWDSAGTYVVVGVVAAAEGTIRDSVTVTVN